MPHFHISGLHAITTFLMVVALFGSLHLAALSSPTNRISQAWLALGF